MDADQVCLTYRFFEYPYRLRSVVNFVLPNFFGTPRDGSYPSPFETGDGIFWENASYLGILPLFFMFFALFKKKKKAWEKAFWFIGVFFLSFGSWSRFSFVFCIYLFPI